MTESPARLLTPAERDATIARLSHAFAQDVLPLEEFERRVAEAYRATTSVALTSLTADLPDAAPPDPHAVATRSPMASQISSIFSSVERSGPVLVPARLDIDAIFGNVELDFRAAEFASPLTEIHVSCIFANVELQFPNGVTVENNGSGLLGNFSARTLGGIVDPAPHTRTVRITGHAFVGNVECVTGTRHRR